MSSLLLELEQQACELPLKQQQLLISFLQDHHNSQSSINMLTNNFIAKPECPHCKASHIKRHGKPNGRQRYRCKACSKTFMCTINTPFFRLRKVEEWLPYFKCMLDSLTIRKSARRCNMSIKTAFKWRHCFLALPNREKAERLSGIVEIDETLFRYSEKGNRDLNRKSHKRGGDKAGKGRAKGDWVPVLVALDRENHVFDECLEKADTDTLLGLLKGRVAKDSVVCSDCFLSYIKMTKSMDVEHKTLNFSKKERVKDGVFHIQNVNAYHSRLHQWMVVFHGVATKYLANYLGWFRFFENHDNPNENSMLAMQTQLR